MRAAFYEDFGPADILQVGELPDPALEPGGVLIDVAAATVIPGDWRLRSGELRHIFDVTFPKIPGREGSGVVRAVADGVTAFSPGDPVCFLTVHHGQGSCAAQICRPADDVVALPPGLTLAEGAALLHAGVCAWIGLTDAAEVQPGMEVLIHGGAGAIGTAAICIAKHLGARVTTTCSARNRDYVTGMGADAVVAYDEEDFTETDTRYDVVLDLVGGDVHRRSYEVMKPGGTLSWLIAQPIEDLSADFGVTTVQARIREEPPFLAAVAGLCYDGVLTPQIFRVMPLAEIAEAHRLHESGGVSRGRIVLDIDRSDRRP